MKTKLIIVDGHCSVGKSSISKGVFKQISLDHDAYWLHEECENHPIRHQEFSFGELDTAEGMERNKVGMLHKWAAFRDSILSSGKVCITEGCLLHAYDRFFIHSLWSDEEIAAYYSQVIETIRDLSPMIVFLYRPDLRKSLDKAFLARGQWWKDLILKRDDRHVYFKNHVYVDENSMYDAVAFEQQKMIEIFDGLQCLKVKIDTSESQWDEYVKSIVFLSGSAYRKIDPFPCDLGQYAGKYRRENRPDGDWIIKYDENNQCLYTSLFWPYMPMRCVAENVFELISFPVTMRFQKNGTNMQFRVEGNYEWDYNGQTFTSV